MSIKIENIVGPSTEQWMAVIQGMRNPMNSWPKSDTSKIWSHEKACLLIWIGPDDLSLMKKLAKAGSDHRKFLRQLPIIMDVTAPLYWWKEADTYKVGTVANSCSTMHKIAEKEFVGSDFSCERMSPVAHTCLEGVINVLEHSRKMYNETKDVAYWDDMIQLLPSSFNQKRTLSLNYEVLWNIYQARKDHKLPEWREFCKIVVDESKYFKLIFGIEE